MRKHPSALGACVAAAVLSLVGGLVLGSRLSSPADAAGRTAAPTASAITAPVERRRLESRVVLRGDAVFAGAVQVQVDTTGLATPAVVTGRVPAVGGQVVEGAPLLEITGRPVLALVGDLPTYRTLRQGLRGPDVLQLEQALGRLGLNPGAVDDEFTAATVEAVVRWYRAAGYEPPLAEESAQEALRAAQEQRRAARQAVSAAEVALRAAAGPDTAVERSALAQAREQLAAAEQALTRARAAAATPLPAAEVVYVPSLPRRVDEVKVRRGELAAGPVMSVSGADLIVRGQVDAAARSLLEPGRPATIQLSDGTQVDATVRAITRAGGTGGFDIEIGPGPLSAAQAELLRSANVKVTIPVSATDGEVLAVPLAALSAASDGRSRVEVQRSDGSTELVVVDVGLSADGYVEIRPVGGRVLSVGDLVVVGR